MSALPIALTLWGFLGMLGDLTSTRASDEASAYLDQVERKIMASWRMPEKSAAGLKVVLRMRLEKSGRVTNVQVEKSSGNKRFDDSAVEAVRHASPFRPPPKSFPIGDLRMVLEPTPSPPNQYPGQGI